MNRRKQRNGGRILDMFLNVACMHDPHTHASTPFHSIHPCLHLLVTVSLQYLRTSLGEGNIHLGSSSHHQMGIPIIDPTIGHDPDCSSPSSILLRAKMLVNKNHSNWQLRESVTPPSSLDLEWEHEGLCRHLIARNPAAHFHGAATCTAFQVNFSAPILSVC